MLPVLSDPHACLIEGDLNDPGAELGVSTETLNGFKRFEDGHPAQRLRRPFDF